MSIKIILHAENVLVGANNKPKLTETSAIPLK
ncbi:hypothetical protein IWQ47_000580 [Aquimarina sp. EL_43]|nr:hypothetical protein [Aquimarina sp. EL_43]